MVLFKRMMTGRKNKLIAHKLGLSELPSRRPLSNSAKSAPYNKYASARNQYKAPSQVSPLTHCKYKMTQRKTKMVGMSCFTDVESNRKKYREHGAKSAWALGRSPPWFRKDTCLKNQTTIDPATMTLANVQGITMLDDAFTPSMMVLPIG